MQGKQSEGCARSESWFADQLEESIIFSPCPHAGARAQTSTFPKVTPSFVARVYLQTLSDAETIFSSPGPVSVGQLAAEPYGNGRPDIFSVTGTHTPYSILVNQK